MQDEVWPSTSTAALHIQQFQHFICNDSYCLEQKELFFFLPSYVATSNNILADLVTCVNVEIPFRPLKTRGLYSYAPVLGFILLIFA